MDDGELEEMQKENAKLEAAEGEDKEEAAARRVYINSKIHKPNNTISPEKLTAKELKKEKMALLSKEFKYTKWEEYFRL
jgi:hypothetical protein